MILVFGGEYQGKKEFAIKGLGATEDNILNVTAGGIVEELLESGEGPEDWITRNKDSLKNKAVIIRDISQGLVPMDPKDRAYREMNGRLMIALAKEAEEVYRVFCGLPDRIK